MEQKLINADMPACKLLDKGPAALTNSELLSIVLGGNPTQALEAAKNVLSNNDNLFSSVSRLSIGEIARNYTNTGKAVKIAAVLEISRRRQAEYCTDKISIRTSSDLHQFFASKMAHLEYEIFAVVYLNKANKVLGFQEISKGGITGTVADPRVILKDALDRRAVKLVLAHNHPSGNLKPSLADEDLTQKIKEACRFLDIEILDHLIISEAGYYSFADEGIL